ncbi:hypothetical protein [Polycyclovorans algicola]|uniref:hypothetical protein n=1 Tax=Polycyclovorans algicola TaxID=616992 RepID=UPI0004A72F18|nr:hypothetical protein [Polycyclovorans algicola]
MHYSFGIQWLKAFRSSPEAICELYGPGDGFLFEDPMLDQHRVTTQADLHRLFGPYANNDPDNGIGIHNFRIRAYIGDARCGLLRWEWAPEHAKVFLGLDVAGKPFTTQGHTFHIYDDKGLIQRESSWWDAAEVLRAAGPQHPTKLPTGAPQTDGPVRSRNVVLSGAKAGTLAFAADWCNALGGDAEVLSQLYADAFTSEYAKVDDHLRDTLTNRDMLLQHYGGMAGGQHGRYTFTPTEYLGDARWGLILWNLRIEGANHYRGIPTGGKTVETIGSTFHEYDAEGRIRLESTFFEDNRAFVSLGIPIIRPHYWKADFDPASLG